MNPTSQLPALAAGLLALALLAVPAHAIPRTFVSATGSGAACTRAAPCGSFQAAHDATDPGGEVNCVGTGEYGQGVSILTITKSITIDCAGASGTIHAGGPQAILINTANVVVRLRNLTINGGSGASTGVRLTNGSALYIDKCVITGFADLNGRGISFAPADVAARLYVTDSIISNNEVPTGGGFGIEIDPAGSGSARVVIDRVRLQNNATAINVQAPGSGQATIVQVRNSVISGGGQGIAAFSSPGGGVASVTVDGSSSLLNFTGLRTSGSASFILLARSTIMSNTTGLNTAGGGAILSYQDNQLTGNVTDGAPSGVLSLK